MIHPCQRRICVMARTRHQGRTAHGELGGAGRCRTGPERPPGVKVRTLWVEDLRAFTPRSRALVIELRLLWFVVGEGVWSVFGGLSQIGPSSEGVPQPLAAGAAAGRLERRTPRTEPDVTAEVGLHRPLV